MKLTSYWIFFPALFFYAAMLQNATNVPKVDDYEVILQWLHNFNHADAGHRFLLMFQQYNEHRLLHSRIVYLAYYWLTGGVNFRALIIIADLQLLIVAWISAYFIRKTGIKYWQLAAAVWMFCLFDLNTYESASIAMYGMQNYGVIMLFFLALYFYERQKPAIASLFQFLLIFSSGNGQIGSLWLCAYILAAPGSRRARILCLGTGITCTALYYVGYHRSVLPGALPYDLSTMITFLIRNAGAYIDFDSSFFFGFLVLGLFAWVFPYKKFRQQLPFVCIAAFVLSSMTTAAVMRSCLTWAQFQASRYLIYPQLLVGCTLVFTFIKYSNYAKATPPIPGHHPCLRKELPLRKGRVRKNARS